jgi:hypothetical protein
MVVASFLKIVLTLLGLITTMYFLIQGLMRKDRKKFKNAAIIFFSTALLLIMISILEFALQ